MIVVDDRLVGIFTERDVVFRVVARRLDVDSTCVGDVMTPAPRTVGPEEPLGVALITMHENGFRHLPVLEEGRLVGVVSARSAMDPELEEFTAEATRRRYFARMR
jgi:CBS domain-containing protein